MGIKTRNMSGDFTVVPVATGTAGATVASVGAGYPFIKKGVISHLVIGVGALPTGGTGTNVAIDIIKNPTSLTASAITGGTSIFGATKPSFTWGAAGAAANTFIEFGTTGAANEVGSAKVPAGWAVGTGLTSGVLQSCNPGDVYAIKTTLDNGVTTGTIVTVSFAFDVYPLL